MPRHEVSTIGEKLKTLSLKNESQELKVNSVIVSLKETNKKIAEIISNPFAFNAGPETDAKDEAI